MQVKRLAQLLALAVAVCLCLGCHGRIRAVGGAGHVPASPAQLLTRSVIVQRQGHRFTVYLPPGYTTSHLWPGRAALQGTEIVAVPIQEAVKQWKLVPQALYDEFVTTFNK